MTTKTMEVVVCDLCKKDRPAIAQVTIDVCTTHDAMLSDRLEPYKCEHCDRRFTTSAGRKKHTTDVHGG